MINLKIENLNYNKKNNFITFNNNFICDEFIMKLLVNYISCKYNIVRLDIFINRFTFHYQYKNKERKMNFRYDFLYTDDEYFYICEDEFEKKLIIRKLKMNKLTN